MYTGFQELINQIIREQGILIFQHIAQCRGLLYDYAKGKYKREIRLFLLALEGGCYQEMRAPGDLEPIKQRLIRRLQAGYGMNKAEAQEALNLVLPILEEPEEDAIAKEIDRLERSARKGDYRAMYELGVLLEKLAWYEESNYWLKKVAKQGLLLYERSLQEPKKQAGSEKNQSIPGDLVKIPGGTFMMGSPITDPGWSAQETQHQVRVSGFYMGKYAVTQEAYEMVMGTNPGRFIGANLPVENVNWFEAAAYCNVRSLQEKLTPAYMINREHITWNRNTTGYRLPTEAEWEYACRAGTVTPFYTGNNITTDQANYNGTIPYTHNVRGTYRQKTTPVGTFPANPWGLYDMYGNVYEWCWDRYGDYRIGSQRDPTGPSSGDHRVIRGGSWNYSARSLRSACRNSDTPAHRSSGVGFRVIRPSGDPED
ncbi:MAG: formylglycine-generating enzyme family protein [Treponema sp.]|jgi:formylglycine-generating enzyme required for sulfatase activity|nr:formylglycine-generating enzyme family protein [Treponema sp.]